MPIYKYRCLDCGARFDIEATVEEKKNHSAAFTCTACGSSRIEQDFKLEDLIPPGGG